MGLSTATEGRGLGRLYYGTQSASTTCFVMRWDDFFMIPADGAASVCGTAGGDPARPQPLLCDPGWAV